MIYTNIKLTTSTPYKHIYRSSIQSLYLFPDDKYKLFYHFFFKRTVKDYYISNTAIEQLFDYKEEDFKYISAFFPDFYNTEVHLFNNSDHSKKNFYSSIYILFQFNIHISINGDFIILDHIDYHITITYMNGPLVVQEKTFYKAFLSLIKEIKKTMSPFIPSNSDHDKKNKIAYVDASIRCIYYRLLFYFQYRIIVFPIEDFHDFPPMLESNLLSHEEAKSILHCVGVTF